MKNKKGFTLIELIITMMVLSVVLGILTGVVTFSTTFFREESEQVKVQESLRLFAVNFEKDIRKFVEKETFFESTESGNIKTYNLGDPLTPNFVSYVFNSNEGIVYRTYNSVTNIVAYEVKDLVVTLDTIENPFIQIEIEGNEIRTSLENKINVKVFLRLLNEGG